MGIFVIKMVDRFWPAFRPIFMKHAKVYFSKASKPDRVSSGREKLDLIRF
jgi:hypothetical protein